MARVASSRETEGGKVAEIVERKRSCYLDNLSEAEKPFKDRKKIRGRDGETTIRKYHMTSAERKRLIAEAAASGGVVNPLKGRVGAYWGQVEALILLGANEWHSLKKIATKMEEVMSAKPKKKEIGGKTVETTLWADFFDKPSRNGASKPKDGMGRIEQNFKVLQRLPRPGKAENNSYGIKLAQFGMCIDMEYREVSPGICLPFVKLNTGWTPWEWDGVSLPPPAMHIVPFYSNPGSKRKKKAAPAAVEPSTLPPEEKPASEIAAFENQPDTQSPEVQAVEPTPIADPITDAVAEGMVAMATDILENGSGEAMDAVLTAPAEDTGLKPPPPDDFEQQIEAYEREKQSEE